MLEAVHKRCANHKGSLDELLKSIHSDETLNQSQRHTLSEQVEALHSEHRLIYE
jgi:hypothetical protein